MCKEVGNLVSCLFNISIQFRFLRTLSPIPQLGRFETLHLERSTTYLEVKIDSFLRMRQTDLAPYVPLHAFSSPQGTSKLLSTR